MGKEDSRNNCLLLGSPPGCGEGWTDGLKQEPSFRKGGEAPGTVETDCCSSSRFSQRQAVALRSRPQTGPGRGGCYRRGSPWPMPQLWDAERRNNPQCWTGCPTGCGCDDCGMEWTGVDSTSQGLGLGRCSQAEICMCRNDSCGHHGCGPTVAVNSAGIWSLPL